jgi:hypothetical protein
MNRIEDEIVFMLLAEGNRFDCCFEVGRFRNFDLTS